MHAIERILCDLPASVAALAILAGTLCGFGAIGMAEYVILSLAK